MSLKKDEICGCMHSRWPGRHFLVYDWGLASKEKKEPNAVLLMRTARNDGEAHPSMFSLRDRVVHSTSCDAFRRQHRRWSQWRWCWKTRSSSCRGPPSAFCFIPVAQGWAPAGDVARAGRWVEEARRRNLEVTVATYSALEHWLHRIRGSSWCPVLATSRCTLAA